MCSRALAPKKMSPAGSLMVTLRCTQKLLRRIGGATKAEVPRATTVLGDWYCNLVYTRPEQLVLCMNERSLLAVLLPAKNFKDVGPRFQSEVIALLTRIGVPQAAKVAEERAMEEVVFGPTANRRVLGCLNEAMFALSYELDEPRFGSIAEIEDHFAEYIYSPTKYRRPKELALELFEASGTASGIAAPRVH